MSERKPFTMVEPENMCASEASKCFTPLRVMCQCICHKHGGEGCTGRVMGMTVLDESARASLDHLARRR